MATVTHGQEVPALLVVDPYNDFISEGGKVWDRLKTVAEANDCVPHMLHMIPEAFHNGPRYSGVLAAAGFAALILLGELARLA